MANDVVLTPMMKQFFELKAKHPDAVMLFRCGDFYETYSEDAIVASEILGITLTKRANGQAKHVEMAGFPFHALDTYLPKLVRAGKRVAICDQLEDPKLTKKLVKRGITELVTPGVAINDNVLSYKENNFLAAVHFGKSTCGVAFLDISTGEFLTAEGPFDYIDKLGYYCTESSEHNAEYNPFYIKPAYPELIDRFNIPLDEYPRRCINQIKDWKEVSEKMLSDPDLGHTRSTEYASYIMEAMVTGKPYAIGGNVLNTGHLIADFPENACVEVPCLVDGMGIHPTHVGSLPPVLAAMNMTNINTQLLTIEAARTRKKEDILRAVMLEPRCAAILSIDDMAKMVDELLQAHGPYMAMYR